MNKKIIVDYKNANERIDKVLSLLLPEYSRSYISSLIKEGKCSVNSEVVKSSYKVSENDEIILEVPETKPLEVKAENIPLNIVYEDDDILIINKEQGMVVHPSAKHYEGTLVNAILAHCSSLSGINGVARPGIVHRIDKDTCGLICVAKNDIAHKALAEQLKDHTMNREYYALVKGIIKENKGTIDLPIARSKKDPLKMEVNKEGKYAITHFEVMERYQDHTLIKCKLETGRTHQIRVHLAYITHPVEGDPLYSGKHYDEISKTGQLLQAYKLSLIHPSSKKLVSFEIPIDSKLLIFKNK